MKLITASLLLFLLFSALQAQVISRKGKDKAVFFAVEDYSQATGWKKLKFPIQESERLAKVLRDDFGFETEVIKNPTKIDIFNKLNELRTKKYASDDQLLLFFSGYGVVQEDSLGYFITREVRATHVEAEGLPYVQLKPKINRIGCQHILLMIDACHSGSLFIEERNDPFKKPKWMREQSLSELRKAKITQLMNKETYRYGMTSGAIHETTPDHSAFAWAFYNGLLQVQRNGQAYTTLKHIWRENMTTIKPLPQQGKYSATHIAYSSFFFFSNNAPDSIVFKERVLQGKVMLTNYWKYGDLYVDEQLQRQLKVGAVEFELPIGTHRFEIRQGGQMKWQKTALIREGLTKLETATSNREIFSNGDTKRDFPKAPKMVYVKGGRFTMGCTVEQENCYDREKPVHQVQLNSYWMGETEVTKEEFCTFLNSYGSNKVLSGIYEGEIMVFDQDEYHQGIKDGTHWKVVAGYEKYPILL